MRVQVAGIKSAVKHMQTAGLGFPNCLRKGRENFQPATGKNKNMNENTLGLFQHFLNNVLISTCTHFLGNSSEHLLVDTDTLKETCRHINQAGQKKDLDTNLLDLN